MWELRVRRPAQPAIDAWRSMPIQPRGSTLLGISFRPRQAEAFALDGRATLERLLAYPFPLIRLGAYWNRIEWAPHAFDWTDLDWQLDAAERAGKHVILAIGPIKNFGYPEFYVPAHHLPAPLPERALIRPQTHPVLLAAACALIVTLATRYRGHQAVRAWQLEHEAVDPLGVEHSWRLSQSFVEQELSALRSADSTRPILMNGYLPTSSLVQLTQWWRTRDQGDSLALAARLADWVGIDYYPRHALARVGPRTLYLDAGDFPWERRRRRALWQLAASPGKRVLISEGQAEPWEAVTVPPSLRGRVLYSCPPERVIANYNTALGWDAPGAGLYAYLFWGAEYWMVRDQSGDTSYLDAFARIVAEA